MTEPIISVSGLRGIVGESLTPLVAIRYATAFAGTLPAGKIVISQDGRASGPALACAVAAGLNAVGRSVIDAGVAATPTTGVLVRQLAAAGGIQISASHNPAPYNGMKLFSAEGRVLPAAAGQRVIERYRTETIDWVGQDRLGKSEPCADTSSEHLALVHSTAAVDAIRRQKYRVLLDATHGAGGALGRRMLESLGCQVTVIGETPDGLFEHPPEPTLENLATVVAAMASSGAAIGFCQDPDADRLAVIDDRGTYLGEEYTLALCVDYSLARRQGPVVTNCSTSRMAEDLAGRYGVPFFRSAVGEANVVDRMLAEGATIGGEGNGGVIDPRVVLVRDSFVAMGLILSAMAQSALPVSALAAQLPRYEIVKTKFPLPSERVPPLLDSLQQRFPEALASRIDGLRLDWPGQWLLVRPSNTEPIVRAIAEAPTRQAAEELCEAVAQLTRGPTAA